MDVTTQFDPEAQSRVQRALERILRSLARVLLRQGIGYTAFAETAKRIFVTVATEEFGLRSRPASKSRVALMTGLNRRDVARVQRLATADAEPQMYNPALRIVSTWIRDPAYRDDSGQPLELPVLGPAPSIEALRGLVCPDVPITAVTRELLNTGVACSADEDATRPGRIALRVDGYVPYQDATAKLEFMGTDVAALLETIGWNLENPGAPKFQRKVSFNNLSAEGVAKLTAVAADQGMALLKTLDTDLACHTVESGGEFAGMGIYVFNESASLTTEATAESRQ